jgi:hypothetical protein
MNTNFRVHFNDVVYPKLRQLEQKRRRLVLYIILIVLCYIALMWFLLFLGMMPLIYMGIFAVALVYSSVVWFINKFRLQFKPVVLPLVLEYINPDAVYYPFEYIPLDTFNRSLLFGSNPLFYKGEDYLRGYIGEVNFEFSELTVEHPYSYKSGNQTIFKGIFMHATFREQFLGRIIILPRDDLQHQTRAIKNITREGGRQVSLDSEAFNNYFVAYAWTEFRAEHVISPQLMAKMVEFRKVNKKRLHLSFVDGQIYIAITDKNDILEPRIFLRNDRYETVEQYYIDFSALINLVVEFDLSV